MISKDILHSDFLYSDEYGQTTNREEMCALIDRWKYLLIERGAGKGDSLGISLVRVNTNNIALVIAAGELAMKVLLLDKPVCMETVDRTKAALYAPINFLVLDSYLDAIPHYRKMVDDYANNIIMESEIDAVTERMTEIWGTAEDDYIMSSTSGTTFMPQKYIVTQEEAYRLAFRNSQVFGYQEESRVCHTRNLHHVSSMTHFLLPSLIASKYHYYYNIYHDISMFPEWLRNTEITHVFFGSAFVVRDLVKYANHPMKVPLTINISGFTIPEEYIQICKDLNVIFDSHYGSVQTGGPTLINRVTADSVFEPNWLGVEPDDYFKMDAWFDGVQVLGPYPGFRMIDDDLREEDGKWYHIGRSDASPLEKRLKKEYPNIDLNVYGRFVVIWSDDIIDDQAGYKTIHLNKELWTTETKVNAYQLMGYLEKL